jgi:putative colanic acid biosynthesis glycosyltransferase
MAAEVELIIIDGGSGDELHDVVGDLQGQVSIVSEADNGIYDAMNKGLRLSRGDFVWFLNGGDVSTVQQPGELSKYLRQSLGQLVLAAYSLETGYESIHRKSRDSRYIWHGLPTSHQAIFYPGDQTREYEYDGRYKIVGDYELTARMISSGTARVRHGSRCVSTRGNFAGSCKNGRHRSVASPKVDPRREMAFAAPKQIATHSWPQSPQLSN